MRYLDLPSISFFTIAIMHMYKIVSVRPFFNISFPVYVSYGGLDLDILQNVNNCIFVESHIFLFNLIFTNLLCGVLCRS